MAGDEEWLDVDEAARYLSMPNRSIRRRIQDGDLEAIGSPARIRRQDLDDFIDRCRIKPGDLEHLNAYPGGASRPGQTPTTSKGRPDRRFGPRYSADIRRRTSATWTTCPTPAVNPPAAGGKSGGAPSPAAAGSRHGGTKVDGRNT